MNLDQQKEEIRATCIKANPEEDWNVAERTDGMWKRPIRLADVLLAIGETRRNSPVDVAIDAYARFRRRYGGGDFEWVKSDDRKSLIEWNLHTDDLEQQSDETVAFIHSLLSV